MDLYDVLLAKATSSGGGGGGGFTPTDAQLAAMNSGITSEDVEQIGTNESNISSLQDKSDRIVMDSNETTILYFQGTQPSNPHDGDCWIDCSTT